MTTAGSVSIQWIPEDDLLLKNSVEAGASLEALAKGAVQFSRRFSFRELQDRWRSLLYDPDVSAQASTHMSELELAGFSPLSRNSRYENSKGNREVSEKRKIGSIRKQYYFMRKKFRTEYFNPTDLGFLDEPSLHASGGHVADFQVFNGEPPNSTCVLGSSVANHIDFQESEIEILRNAFSKPARDSSVIAGAAGNHSSYITDFPNTHKGKHPNDTLRSYGFSEDVSTSFQQNGTSFEQNDKHRLSTFGKDSAVNFNEHLGVHGSGLPESLQMQPLSLFDSKNDNPQNVIRGSRQEHHLNSPRDNSSFQTIGFSSAQPNLPLWDPVDDFSANPMPVSLKQGDATQDADEMVADDGKGNSSFVYDAVHSEPILGVSESEFGDLPDSLLNLSNEDDILLPDVDGKVSSDKSCTDNLNSIILSSPKNDKEDGANNLEPEPLVTPKSCLADSNCADLEKSVPTTSSIYSDHQNNYHPEHSELSESTLALGSQALGNGSICCTLNTEDPEIPCNDDIFLLIHPSTSFVPSASQPNPVDLMEPSSGRKQIEPGMNLIMDKEVARSSNWLQKSGPNISPEALPRTLVGSKVKSELSDMNSKDLLPKVANKTIGDLGHSGPCRANVNLLTDGMLENNISRLDFKAGEGLETLPRARNTLGGSLKRDISEPLVNPSTSDQEESQSDDDVPYFSDIEAMILEMDLDPQYQDSHRTKQVSRYHSEEKRRSIIRLEQCAQSCLQRAMTSMKAFAIFYGRHLRHYIRKTEVIIGRSTEDAEVDIDLKKEGRANKISRQQAIVKMEANGSFYLKNLGKSLISVNGKSVAKGQLICLSSSCLIEGRRLLTLLIFTVLSQRGEKVVHIIDLHCFEPAQWINLLQELKVRREGPPQLRITGIHEQKEVFDQMDHRLSAAAEKLDIGFQFNSIVGKLENLDIESLQVKSGEAVAISSVLQLHSLLAYDDETISKLPKPTVRMKY